MSYIYLAIAIIGEVVATSALKACDGFTRPALSLIVILGYGISLLCLSLTLRTIPVGIAYAIWAGAGTALIATAGVVLYKQILDLPAILGMTLIVAGVVVVNGFSNMLAP